MSTEKKRLKHSFLIAIGAFGLICLGVVAYSIIGAVRLYLAQPTTSQGTVSNTDLRAQALVQQGSGDLASAERTLRQVVGNEESAETLRQLAVVQYQQRRYEEAIRSYERMVSRGFDVAFAHNGIGNAYRDWAVAREDRRREFLEEALSAYRLAITIDAGYVAAYSNAALLLSDNDRRDEAFALIDTGITATNSQILRDIRTRL